MVRNNDDFVAVPNLGINSKFPFEYADCPRPAHIVRHQDVRADPHVVPGRHLGLPDARARIFSVKVISSSKVNPLLHPDKPRFKTDLNRSNQRRNAENARFWLD